MEVTLIFMYICAGIACIGIGFGIGFGGIAIGITTLRGKGLIWQDFSEVHHPYVLLPDGGRITFLYHEANSTEGESEANE